MDSGCWYSSVDGFLSDDCWLSGSDNFDMGLADNVGCSVLDLMLVRDMAAFGKLAHMVVSGWDVDLLIVMTQILTLWPFFFGNNWVHSDDLFSYLAISDSLADSWLVFNNICSNNSLVLCNMSGSNNVDINTLLWDMGSLNLDNLSLWLFLDIDNISLTRSQETGDMVIRLKLTQQSLGIWSVALVVLKTMLDHITKESVLSLVPMLELVVHLFDMSVMESLVLNIVAWLYSLVQTEAQNSHTKREDIGLLSVVMSVFLSVNDTVEDLRGTV